MKKYLLSTVISLLALTFSLFFIYLGDISLIDSRLYLFKDQEGVDLVGEYNPGTRKAGIIILEGFGSDQIAMKSITSEFSNIGFHTFSFDFSGQGRSGGTLTFDNAATDKLANQVLIAKEEFKKLSGLNDSNIILCGHSMGARVAVQATTLDTNNISGLILIGVQINLLPNVQAGFFTGVSDTSLFWVKNLSTINPPVDILLVSGTWDDIITPDAARELFEKLGGDSSPYTRELVFFDFLIHNYEIYSPALISYSINWALMDLGIESNPKYYAFQSLLRKIFWTLAFIAIITIPLLGEKYINQFSMEKKEEDIKKQDLRSDNFFEVEISNIKKFYIYKLLAWLGAIPIALALISLFFIIPMGLPIFSLFYVGFLSSYGIFMMILYNRKKMPGTNGKLLLNFKIRNFKLTKKNGYVILGSFSFIGLSILFFNSGINYVFPINSRLIWLIIFTILTIPGFYIGQKESNLLKENDLDGRKYQLVLWIIGLIPFFGVSVLFALLGSISGMIGSIHGILILIVVIITGNFISQLGSNQIIGIVFQSFLIQLLVLTQGSLFAVF